MPALDRVRRVKELYADSMGPLREGEDPWELYNELGVLFDAVFELKMMALNRVGRAKLIPANTVVDVVWQSRSGYERKRRMWISGYAFSKHRQDVTYKFCSYDERTGKKLNRPLYPKGWTRIDPIEYDVTADD
jgi:hypothetical protein